MEKMRGLHSSRIKRQGPMAGVWEELKANPGVPLDEV